MQHILWVAYRRDACGDVAQRAFGLDAPLQLITRGGQLRDEVGLGDGGSSVIGQCFGQAGLALPEGGFTPGVDAQDPNTSAPATRAPR